MKELTGEPVPAEEAGTSLEEILDKVLDISQEVAVVDNTTAEEMDSPQRLEQANAPPPVLPPDTQSQWTVGALCRVVWSEDGREYLAEVVSVDGKCCRVRFCGYGNEQDVELSALRRPDTAASTLQGCQDWRRGSRCRAVFSEDGLVYPAVVLWVKGQHCRVRYDDYNNEEEHNVGDLLSPDELHGPRRTATNKVHKLSVRVQSGCRNIRQAADLTELTPPLAPPIATPVPPPIAPPGYVDLQGSRRSTGTSSSLDWRRRKEETRGQRGGAGGGGEGGEGKCRDDQQNSWVKGTPSDQSKAEKPANHSFPFFPQFPPRQSSLGDPLSFIPPPPATPQYNNTPSMLMLWYMCGFHTGSAGIQAGIQTLMFDAAFTDAPGLIQSQRGLWDVSLY